MVVLTQPAWLFFCTSPIFSGPACPQEEQQSVGVPNWDSLHLQISQTEPRPPAPWERGTSLVGPFGQPLQGWGGRRAGDGQCGWAPSLGRRNWQDWPPSALLGQEGRWGGVLSRLCPDCLGTSLFLGAQIPGASLTGLFRPVFARSRCLHRGDTHGIRTSFWAQLPGNFRKWAKLPLSPCQEHVHAHTLILTPTPSQSLAHTQYAYPQEAMSGAGGSWLRSPSDWFPIPGLLAAWPWTRQFLSPSLTSPAKWA